MKKLAPWSWADAMFKQHMPFRDLENWHDEKYAQHDISVHEFLRSHGADDTMIRLGFDTNIAYGTTAHDVSLLQQAFSDNWQNVNRGAVAAFSRTGAANVVPSGPAAAAAPPAGAPPGLLIGAFKGGNQNLPIAMAKALKGDLLLNKRVIAINVDDRSAEVICDDGTRYRAKAVVCSMPFSTLRHVAISPLPEPVKNKAIQTLGHIPITQFHLIAKKPFWEMDGLSPSMWTDGPLGLVLAQNLARPTTRSPVLPFGVVGSTDCMSIVSVSRPANNSSSRNSHGYGRHQRVCSASQPFIRGRPIPSRPVIGPSFSRGKFGSYAQRSPRLTSGSSSVVNTRQSAVVAWKAPSNRLNGSRWKS